MDTEISMDYIQSLPFVTLVENNIIKRFDHHAFHLQIRDLHLLYHCRILTIQDSQWDKGIVCLSLSDFSMSQQII